MIHCPVFEASTLWTLGLILTLEITASVSSTSGRSNTAQTYPLRLS